MADHDDLRGYATVSVIGTGATGVVRVMRHEASGRLLAVKSLAPALVADADFRARFRREAAILETLRHPHITALLWYVESERAAAIGMELVDGVQLRRLIDEGIATPEAALLVLRGSLDALDHAHRAGVVHRDYKPANVIVDGEGTSRLVDFGIAAGVGEAGIVEGTPAYTAPEQWRGAVATPSTDVYACAAVLHECLTGRVPFAADDMAQLRQFHESEPVPLDDVPAALHPLLQRGMAKSSDERYPTAGAFLDELERTASREYGADWGQRGLRTLAGLALGFAAFFPLHGVAAAAPTAAASGAGAGAGAPAAPASAAQSAATASTPTPARLVRSRGARNLARSPWSIVAAAVTAVAVTVGGLAAVHRGPFGSSSPATPVSTALAADFGSPGTVAVTGAAPGSADLAATALVAKPDGRLVETVVLRAVSDVPLTFAYCDLLVCGTSDNADCVGNQYIPRFGGSVLMSTVVPPPPGSHAESVLVLAGRDAASLAPAALVGGGGSPINNAQVLAAPPELATTGVTLSFSSPLAGIIRQHIRNGMMCGFTADQVKALQGSYGTTYHNDVGEVRVVIAWSAPSSSLTDQTQQVNVNGNKRPVPLQPALFASQPSFTPALQKDARWVSVAAGKSTYGVSGTVPATLSTLFSAFGIHLDPPKIGKQLIDGGVWKPGTGTDWKALEGYIAAQPLAVTEVNLFSALSAMRSGTAVMVAYSDKRAAPAQDVTGVLTDYDPGGDTFGIIDPIAGPTRIAWDDLCAGDPWFLAVSLSGASDMIAMLRNRRIVSLAAVVIALVVLAVVLARSHSSSTTSSRPAGATEGVGQRPPLDLHGQSGVITTSGSCFTAYIVQPAGRDASGQHYAVTLTLHADPSSTDDLLRLLASSGCAAEEQKVIKDVDTALKLAAGDGQVTLDYRSPAGARILLPGT